MSELNEKTLTSEEIYRGKVIDVFRDEVELIDGSKSVREVVKHSGGIVIVAQKSDGKILLVQQFRYPIKQATFELPAGKLEYGENPNEACERELREETGYVAEYWKSLGYINTSAGICDEKLYLYFANHLEFEGQDLDEGEFLNVFEYDLKEILDMIKQGKINDAKTICGIFRAFLNRDFKEN